MNISRRGALGALAACQLHPSTRSAGISNVTLPGAVNNPYGLRTGPDGGLYVCEIGNHRISKIDLSTGRLNTVIDGQKEPYDLRFDARGNLFFADMPAHQVRRIDRRSGKLTLVAGTGEPGFSGDGGPASRAQLRQPHSIAFDADGRLLICDIGNHRIRRVDLDSGTIDTFAGTGERGPTPDGAPRQGTPLHGPRAIDGGADGSLYIVLREGNAVFRLGRDDRFQHFAGTGEKGYAGDGGDARRARLSGPKGISCAPDGSVYIADTESHTIRRIGTDRIISTVAGTGERGDGPTGNPLQCKLSRPHGIFVDARGTIFIGDSEANKVRVMDRSKA